MLSGIWKWLTGGAALVATVLYAMLQRHRAASANKRADRAEQRAMKAHDVAQARDNARREAERNEQQTRERVRNRRAGLNNDRL